MELCGGRGREREGPARTYGAACSALCVPPSLAHTVPAPLSVSLPPSLPLPPLNSYQYLGPSSLLERQSG